MRLLAVLESPPTSDPVAGNGSTLISAHLLRNLPADIELDLVYFDDRAVAPDADVVDRAASVRRLTPRSGRLAVLAQPFVSVPRATWRRAVGKAELATWGRNCDVAYLHGLHVAPLSAGLGCPALLNEVDPWSDYWRERAARRRGPKRWYDTLQAARAARLEQRTADAGVTTVVVNPADADRLRRRTGGRVVAIPNGTPRPARPPAGDGPAIPVPAGRTLAFVGTLDYPPNVESVERLVREVWPVVRARVPDARLVVAGRRPVEAVRALAGHGVEVWGAVDDVRSVFGSSRVAGYVGVTGRGTKNTVSEAIAAGCPVVASPESARGHRTGLQLSVAADAVALAGLITRLLVDDEHAAAAREACRAAAGAGLDWPQTIEIYVEELRRCAAQM